MFWHSIIVFYHYVKQGWFFNFTTQMISNILHTNISIKLSINFVQLIFKPKAISRALIFWINSRSLCLMSPYLQKRSISFVLRSVISWWLCFSSKKWLSLKWNFFYWFLSCSNIAMIVFNRNPDSYNSECVVMHSDFVTVTYSLWVPYFPDPVLTNVSLKLFVFKIYQFSLLCYAILVL